MGSSKSKIIDYNCIDIYKNKTLRIYIKRIMMKFPKEISSIIIDFLLERRLYTLEFLRDIDIDIYNPTIEQLREICKNNSKNAMVIVKYNKNLLDRECWINLMSNPYSVDFIEEETKFIESDKFSKEYFCLNPSNKALEIIEKKYMNDLTCIKSICRNNNPLLAKKHLNYIKTFYGFFEIFIKSKNAYRVLDLTTVTVLSHTEKLLENIYFYAYRCDSSMFSNPHRMTTIEYISSTRKLRETEWSYILDNTEASSFIQRNLKYINEYNLWEELAEKPHMIDFFRKYNIYKNRNRKYIIKGLLRNPKIFINSDHEFNKIKSILI